MEFFRKILIHRLTLLSSPISLWAVINRHVRITEQILIWESKIIKHSIETFELYSLRYSREENSLHDLLLRVWQKTNPKANLQTSTSLTPITLQQGDVEGEKEVWKVVEKICYKRSNDWGIVTLESKQLWLVSSNLTKVSVFLNRQYRELARICCVRFTLLWLISSYYVPWSLQHPCKSLHLHVELRWRTASFCPPPLTFQRMNWPAL